MQTRKLLPTDRPRVRFEFIVEGSDTFPVDMLRYDACWPADMESASYMLARGRRKIRLASHVAPTPERWATFMWRIVG